jgi:predicted RNA binding protein YcfA (HicA-like mRNA interferase family)
MSSVEKMLQKMRNNPRDWRIEDLQMLASRYGFMWRQQGTSHVAFRAPDGKSLSVPAARPIKTVYIRKFLQLIDSMKG